MCVCVCVCVCVHIHTYIHTHIRTYTHTYIRVCTLRSCRACAQQTALRIHHAAHAKSRHFYITGSSMRTYLMLGLAFGIFKHGQLFPQRLQTAAPVGPLPNYLPAQLQHTDNSYRELGAHSEPLECSVPSHTHRNCSSKAVF